MAPTMGSRGSSESIPSVAGPGGITPTSAMATDSQALYLSVPVGTASWSLKGFEW